MILGRKLKLMTIMKKINLFILAALATAAAAVSCQQENLEPEVQEQDGVTFVVDASLSEITKAVLTDGESLQWRTDDNVAAYGIAADGSLTAQAGVVPAAIDETFTKATFSFNTLPQGGRAWVAYNCNSGYGGCNASKLEYHQFLSTMEQEAAGQVNPAMLRLLSDEISVPTASEGENTITLSDVRMKLVGTLLRCLIYSPSGLYADENVLSVEFISKDKNVAGAAGACMAYNFNEGGKYLQPDGTHSEECQLFWAADSKIVTTNLKNPLSLDGKTSATEGTGIYISVPPVSVAGYTYVVTTDWATYTFDSSSSLTFRENELKNVLLNLENAKVIRTPVEFDFGLDVSEFKTSVDVGGGANFFTINASSPVSWTLEIEPAATLTITETGANASGTISASGTHKVAINYGANTAATSQIYTIKVKTANANVENKELTLSFVQKGTASEDEPVFNVDKTEVNVDAASTATTLNISASDDVAWTINSDNADLSFEPSAGTGNATVIVSFPVNESAEVRTADITLSTQAAVPTQTYEISFTQSTSSEAPAENYKFEAANSVVSFGANDTPVFVYMDCAPEVDWTYIVEGPDCSHASTKYDNGGGFVVLHTGTNPGFTERVWTVTFTTENPYVDNSSFVVTVTQAAKEGSYKFEFAESEVAQTKAGDFTGWVYFNIYTESGCNWTSGVTVTLTEGDGEPVMLSTDTADYNIVEHGTKTGGYVGIQVKSKNESGVDRVWNISVMADTEYVETNPITATLTQTSM